MEQGGPQGWSDHAPRRNGGQGLSKAGQRPGLGASTPSRSRVSRGRRPAALGSVRGITADFFSKPMAQASASLTRPRGGNPQPQSALPWSIAPHGRGSLKSGKGAAAHGYPTAPPPCRAPPTVRCRATGLRRDYYSLFPAIFWVKQRRPALAVPGGPGYEARRKKLVRQRRPIGGTDHECRTGAVAAGGR